MDKESSAVGTVATRFVRHTHYPVSVFAGPVSEVTRAKLFFSIRTTLLHATSMECVLLMALAIMPVRSRRSRLHIRLNSWGENHV